MRKIVLIIIFFFYECAIAQDTGFKFPPTPEAGSFNSFFNQVSTSSTGNPNINIPLYSIEVGGTSIPISLNYVGGTGIKVDEIASRVGLGWQLDIGGGSVTRSIVGRPDTDRPKLKTLYDADEICNFTPDKEFLIDLVANEMDSFFPHPAAIGLDMRPDIFNYSLMSSGGKFLYDNMGKAQQIPKGDNIISDSQSTLSNIIITDNTGIKYSFKNVVVSIPFRFGFEGHIYMDSYKPTELIFPNSEKLAYLYGKTFSFKQFTTISQTQISRKIIFPVGFCNGLPKETSSAYGSKTLEDVITEMDFPKGKVIFNYGDGFREDLAGDRYLKNITVYNNAGKIVKSYTFSYDYFISDYTDQSNLTFSESETGKNYKRLKLVSIADDVAGGVYQFDYDYQVPLPPRFSSSIDSWGLYNGKANGKTRVGGFVEDNHFYYADRSFDANFAKSGMLKKITYPTKGTTEIFFEPDDYYFNGSVEEYSSQLDSNNQPINSNNIFLSSDQPGQQLSKTFTVSASDFDFWGTFYSEMYDGVANPPEAVEECKVKIISPSGVQTEYRTNGDFALNTSQNSTYSVLLTNNAQGLNKCYFDIRHRHKSSRIVLNRQVGSFRTKKIMQDDKNGNVYTKIYEYKNSDSASTGTLMDEDVKYDFIDDNFYKNSLQQPTRCVRPGSSSEPKSHINSHFGKPVSYTKITEKTVSGTDEIRNERYYKNESIGNYQLSQSSINPKPIEEYKNGVLYKAINYKGSNKVSQTIYENEYDYYFNQFSNDEIGSPIAANPLISQGMNANYDNVIICMYTSDGKPIYGATFKKQNYPIYSAWVKPISESTTQYFGNNFADSISVKKQFFYSPNYLHIKPIREKVTYSNGNVLDTYYNYTKDKGNQYLIDKNMVGMPLQTTTTKTANNVTKTLSDVETQYPASQTEANAKTTGLPLPYQVVSKDLLGVSTTEVTYDQYDSKGNLQQYTSKSGTPVAIIWGYGQTQPIAKIEGAKYDDVKTLQVVLDAISTSNTDAADPTKEGDLITALDNLRKISTMSNYQITTYTYDPLIGVTSITPPSGIREIYKYDSANRLQSVVDINGNILKEYQYNYKH